MDLSTSTGLQIAEYSSFLAKKKSYQNPKNTGGLRVRISNQRPHSAAAASNPNPVQRKRAGRKKLIGHRSKRLKVFASLETTTAKSIPLLVLHPLSSVKTKDTVQAVPPPCTTHTNMGCKSRMDKILCPRSSSLKHHTLCNNFIWLISNHFGNYLIQTN